MLHEPRMEPRIDDIDRLTERVIACAIEVHKQMGPGLNEGVYGECLTLELAIRRMMFAADVPIFVSYKGRRLRKHFEIDLLVDNRLIVELKAVEALHPVHQAQVLTYPGLKRLDHPDRYAKKHKNPV